jgi:dihydrofolate reductase
LTESGPRRRCSTAGWSNSFATAQPGGDVGVHASISVAQARLAADVVDELRLVIAPRIAGRGRRLLDGSPSIQFESIRSETSPTGYLLVDYRVSR